MLWEIRQSSVVFRIFSCSVISVILIASLLIFVFILRFFRKPSRIFRPDNNTVFSPADGTIVAIEEVYEPEYFRDKRLLVSVFMSVWNVHINWYPVTGKVKYFRYHPGKYLLARHPKSSELNERTSLVLETGNNHEVMVRQIAGIVARKIVFYPEEGQLAQSGDEMGFIKFGSRVDVYLPLSSKVVVNLNDKVKGKLSPLAVW
ncbi:MAG: phosphatidylserine decarboxylase family protein [bacterium]